MVAIEHRMVHFRLPDISEVADEVAAIAADSANTDWLTISPWVDPADLPVTSVLRRIFSARGSKIPEVTWVSAQGDEPAQLGIIHATGPNAHERLIESDTRIPPTWVKISDHSKRGLLYAVHPDSTPTEVVSFAVAAAVALAAVPTDDRWVAQISTTRA